MVSTSTTKRSDVDHTVTCIYTTYAFPSYKYSIEGETAANSFIHLATDILLMPRPTEGRRLRWLGWLTHSGRLTTMWSHVNHGSGVDQGKFASYRPTS